MNVGRRRRREEVAGVREGLAGAAAAVYIFGKSLALARPRPR